ncbi:MAG: hypothetical protein RLZZ591_2712 [Pseudomonadota bacterium]|jgi:hypothetical protein
MSHPTHNYTSLFTRRQTLMALLGSIALPGCGGGSVAGLSSGGTGSFTNGVIIGLGSIIVNGIRYDDTKATVNGGTGASNDLKLGMVVSVQGSSVTPPTVTGGLATATASSISYGSEWKGPIDSVNVSEKSFVMLGQTVHWLTNTVFSPGPIESIGIPIYAEVYGFVNAADGVLQASRVEFSSRQPDEYRLSGAISNLNTEGDTFELGDAVINFGSAPKLSDLQDGIMVRVDIDPESTGSPWAANRVRTVNPLGDINNSDDDEAEIEGSITDFTSGSLFLSVNGIPVDASLADFDPRNLTLGLGLRVKVEGAVVNGTVVASKVELESDEAVAAREFEFHDRISQLDTILRTFKVRGNLVTYTDKTTLDLHSNSLADELRVEVKAVIGPNGQLTATKIELDN